MPIHTRGTFVYAAGVSFSPHPMPQLCKKKENTLPFSNTDNNKTLDLFRHLPLFQLEHIDHFEHGKLKVILHRLQEFQ